MINNMFPASSFKKEEKPVVAPVAVAAATAEGDAAPSLTFDQMPIPQQLKSALAAMKFTTPTPIQAQAIPLIMEGRDILATAMTGSGKTGGFCIPMIARMLANSRGTALIMLPTRELAAQVEKVVKELLGPNNAIKSAILIGGESMPKQQQQLRARPRIIVGTPGRIIDHLQRGSLMLHDASYIVLDEADRMLDMGFEDQILAVLKYLPQQRQTLLFSATLSPVILKLSERYLKTPARIEIGEANKAADNIDQQIKHVSPEGKYDLLVSELKARQGTVIIFVRAKYGTEKLATKLKRSGFTAEPIHGDLEQRQRERVLTAFRNRQHRILVATDIASRGLDIPHIEHVINYDLPQAPEDYIHRIGRTARAGADGAAISFITPEDGLKWRNIQKLMHPDVAPDPLPAGAPTTKKKRGRSGGGGRGGNGHGNSGGGTQGGNQGGGRSGGGRPGGGHRGQSADSGNSSSIPASLLRAV
ncbi:MAG: DEAD/DEAH box helicase [Rickettsiales bacterium]